MSCALLTALGSYNHSAFFRQSKEKKKSKLKEDSSWVLPILFLDFRLFFLLETCLLQVCRWKCAFQTSDANKYNIKKCTNLNCFCLLQIVIIMWQIKHLCWHVNPLIWIWPFFQYIQYFKRSLQYTLPLSVTHNKNQQALNSIIMFGSETQRCHEQKCFMR